VGKRLHDPKHGGSSPRVTTVASGANRFPRCEYCGSERVFELQLVPHAITVLEESREGVGLGPKDDAGMEWGTIILGVCSKDCGPKQVGVVGWREEWAGVQWEELTK
jgi:pre-rRNA-processing protein TSR4